jgi:geranyl-CoA carboxylase beta subunit
MIFQSRAQTSGPIFDTNKSDMLKKVGELRSFEARAKEASEKRRPRFEERGQLTPRERLSALLDPGMPFLELYNMASFLVDDPNPDTSIPGASIIMGIGFISGVRSMVFVDDSGIAAGAATTQTVQKAVGCLAISLKQKLPFVHLVESAGANLMTYTVELWANGGGMYSGLAKLSASGIPVVTVLHGASTAGGAYQPGMSDYVIGIKKNGMAMLAGAALVRAATGEISEDRVLGGAEMHSEKTGLVEFLAEDDAHGIEIARDVVSRLNWNEKVSARKPKSFQAPRYSTDQIVGIVPIDYKKPYDVREVVARLVDNSDFIDVKPDYGPATICLQARVFGQDIGIIGNNGPIDPDGAAKVTHFLQLCDQSQRPVIFLNNTTGYMVGVEYEHAGMIKHGSKMIQTVTNLRVPKISLYIGASFGAGNYGMCGHAFDPDFLFAWPNAMTGVMGGEQAALTMEQVMTISAKKKGKEVDPEAMKKQRLAITEHFDRQSDAFYTSGRLLDMGIIDPRDTRKVLGFCLETCWEAQHRNVQENAFGVARI